MFDEKKKKLAIVSTYNELCGIAIYTKFLKPQLEARYEVTVFDLDQFLLRHASKSVRKLGDKHVAEICAQLAEFDLVNLQLEHGTLGAQSGDVVKRFRMIVEASPQISITFHTMLSSDGITIPSVLKSLFMLRWKSAFADINALIREWQLSGSIFRIMQKMQKKIRLSAITHNKRDMRILKYVHGIKHVFDHPLVFFNQDYARSVRETASRKDFPLLFTVPANAKIIGVFGFVGRYKGFDIVIKALHRLPSNYHLAIFGGVHPNSIKRNQPIDPEIKSLIDAANADKLEIDTLLDRITDEDRKVRSSVSVSLDHSSVAASRYDISDRIHFMGAPDDDSFIKGLAAVDIVVMPYLEVGQSSSGPLSMAVELGKYPLASRTKTFMDFSRYQPDTLEFFEIGNHVELAQRIASREGEAEKTPLLKKTAQSNLECYVAAFEAVSD